MYDIKQTLTLGSISNHLLSKKRNRSMQNLPHIMLDNKSLQVIKPWYYHDRNIPILNCKCPFHKKRVVAHQFIQYEYYHSKGCHNEMIRIQKVKIYKQVVQKSQGLLKQQYFRREVDLQTKRERIKDYRAEKNILRRFPKTPNFSIIEKRKVIKNIDQIQQSGWDDLAWKSNKSNSKAISTQEFNKIRSSDIIKDISELIKQDKVKDWPTQSNNSSKHQSNFVNSRRRGLNFNAFPQVQKYMSCIEKQFTKFIQTNNGGEINQQQFMIIAQNKLMQQFPEIDSPLAKALIKGWLEKDASQIMKLLKRSSKAKSKIQVSSTSNNNSQININHRRRGTVFGGVSAFGLSRKHSDDINPKQNNRQNKQSFRSNFSINKGSSKISRRDSMRQPFNMLPSSFGKNRQDDRSDTFKHSSSKLNIFYLKNKPSDTGKKKKIQKISKKKNDNFDDKLQPFIQGTMILDSFQKQNKQQNPNIADALPQPPIDKKYIKPSVMKHRLAMFNKANSKLLIKKQSGQLLKQISGFRDIKKQLNNSVQLLTHRTQQKPIRRSKSSRDIFNPDQQIIANMVFKNKKRIGKLVFRDENIMNDDHEIDQIDSDEDYQKQEQLLRQLRALRKKRFNMNLINHILFGKEEWPSQSSSDMEEFGSEIMINYDDDQGEKIHKKRNSEEITSKYSSAKLKPNGAKSPLVKFYNLKRDLQEDTIIQNINDILLKNNLRNFTINAWDSRRIRNKKVKKLKQYLATHPQLRAKDLIRNLRLFEQHNRMTKAMKVAAKLNFDPQLLLTLNIPDDTIIKAILKVQSKKKTNPGFGYQLQQIDPYQSSSSSISFDDQQKKLKQKHKRSYIHQFSQQTKYLRFILIQDLIQKSLSQKSNIQDYFVLDEYFKQSILKLKQDNPDIVLNSTVKIIESILPQK